MSVYFQSASQSQIKKAYRKMSLVYHPDKETGDEKKFMMLTKAYAALTDDVARKNWEMYGNPDGPGGRKLCFIFWSLFSLPMAI